MVFKWGMGMGGRRLIIQQGWVLWIRLEERQRAEKKAREKNGHAFVPKWFALSGETTRTPWEALDVYAFNDKYKVAREEVGDSSTLVFNPWQFHDKDVELLQEPSVAQTGVLANK